MERDTKEFSGGDVNVLELDKSVGYMGLHLSKLIKLYA